MRVRSSSRFPLQDPKSKIPKDGTKVKKKSLICQIRRRKTDFRAYEKRRPSRRNVDLEHFLLDFYRLTSRLQQQNRSTNNIDVFGQCVSALNLSTLFYVWESFPPPLLCVCVPFLSIKIEQKFFSLRRKR